MVDVLSTIAFRSIGAAFHRWVRVALWELGAAPKLKALARLDSLLVVGEAQRNISKTHRAFDKWREVARTEREREHALLHGVIWRSLSTRAVRLQAQVMQLR